MPRVSGQIDLAKSEAILEAAAEVFSSRGLTAPLEDIARRAGVSKQTIYNHYGSKADLMRAMIEARVDALTAPLQMAGAADNPEAALTELGREVLRGVLSPAGASMVCLAVRGAAEFSDLARAFYEGGPRTSRMRLAEFLERETRAGRLAVDDPTLAAEFFFGMVIGAHQLRILLNVPTEVGDARVDAIARAAAARFMKAYAA